MKAPLWAHKLSKQLSKQAAKFDVGDVVFVSNAHEKLLPGEQGHYVFGVGVVTEVNTNCGYAIDFGPGKGAIAWYHEELLTSLREVPVEPSDFSDDEIAAMGRRKLIYYGLIIKINKKWVWTTGAMAGQTVMPGALGD